MKSKSIKALFTIFLNNETYDWRKLLTYTAKVYQKRFPANKGKPTVFIVDETSRAKTGRFVEFIGKFRDLCKGCFYKAIICTNKDLSAEEILELYAYW